MWSVGTQRRGSCLAVNQADFLEEGAFGEAEIHRMTRSWYPGEEEQGEGSR